MTALLTALSPQRRRITLIGLSLASGLSAALAFPPFGFLPGLLGYALLLLLWDQSAPPRPLRTAFWHGWLAGCGYFLICTFWVGEAFLVDAANQGWMAPFAMAFLAMGLGLFWGAAGVLYVWIKPHGLFRVLVFTGCFCLLEWLRGHVFTGFPWDLAGESWKAGSAPSQAASLIGAYGLSWITVALGAAPVLLLDKAQRREGLIAAVLAGLVLVCLYGFGLHRLAQAPALSPKAAWVRIVQADVDQQSKYDEAMFRSIVERYTTLTAQPARRTPNVIIWPEGSIPAAANDFLAPGTWTRAAISAALKPGQTLILGAYRSDESLEKPFYYNSLLSLSRLASGLRITGVYDKYRLVPFGEFLPLETILSPLGFKDLTHIGEGFTPGPPPRPMEITGLPRFQPLICYESLFPGFVRNGANIGGRAAWIINVSNDAWFGRTSGPLQHLNLAGYRAIEEGLPIVRSTPTGVSAVIDAFGRVRPQASLALGQRGVIDAQLPPALEPTLFDRLGELFFGLMMGLSALIAPFSRMPRLNP